MKRSEFFKKAAGTVAGVLTTKAAMATGMAAAPPPAPPLLDAEREALQKQYADLFFEKEFEKARFYQNDAAIEKWRQCANELADRLEVAEEKLKRQGS